MQPEFFHLRNKIKDSKEILEDLKKSKQEADPKGPKKEADDPPKEHENAD